MVEIKKTTDKFTEGELYEININLLEEVTEELWNNLI